MLTNLLRRGDKVVININKENREWGYDPCPDGTIATMIGFGEIHYGRLHNFGHKPGIYENHSWPQVQLDNGKELSLNGSNVELIDKDEYKKREKQYRIDVKEKGYSFDKVFLRELPETPYWEGDLVNLLTFDWNGKKNLVVTMINYNYIGTFCNDSVTPYPIYQVSPDIRGGSYMSFRESEMEFVERGPVWKFYHNEPIKFTSIEDEARFHHFMGFTKSVRNPANNIYCWAKDEALKGIKDGLGHMMSGSCNPFALTQTTDLEVYRFNNEEVGKRVADYLLRSFNYA